MKFSDKDEIACYDEVVVALLDSPIGITKLKELQTYSWVQIPVSTFHVEQSIPTFLPRQLASSRTCKYPLFYNDVINLTDEWPLSNIHYRIIVTR